MEQQQILNQQVINLKEENLFLPWQYSGTAIEIFQWLLPEDIVQLSAIHKFTRRIIKDYLLQQYFRSEQTFLAEFYFMRIKTDETLQPYIIALWVRWQRQCYVSISTCDLSDFNCVFDVEILHRIFTLVKTNQPMALEKFFLMLKSRFEFEDDQALMPYIMIQDGFGISLFLHACSTGNNALVEVLKKYGLQKNPSTNLPFLLEKYNLLFTAQYLLEHHLIAEMQVIGALVLLFVLEQLSLQQAKDWIQKKDINIKSKLGSLALCEATCSGNFLMVMLLVESGAPLDDKDMIFDLTPLQIACLLNHRDIVTYLAKQSQQAGISIEMKQLKKPLFFKNTWLQLSIEYDHAKRVAILFEGKNIYFGKMARNVFKKSILYACWMQSWVTATYLIEQEVGINEKDLHGRTALYYAVRFGNLRVVKLLVEKSANLNIVDFYGGTLVSEACYQGHWVMAKYLIEQGALLNVKDYFGHTALRWAAGAYQLDIIKLLIKYGADVSLPVNPQNEDLEMWAIRHQQTEIETLCIASKKQQLILMIEEVLTRPRVLVVKVKNLFHPLFTQKQRQVLRLLKEDLRNNTFQVYNDYTFYKDALTTLPRQYSTIFTNYLHIVGLPLPVPIMPNKHSTLSASAQTVAT